MHFHHSEESSQEPDQAKRCYHCFRPLSDCFCGSIPSIANKTEVLILQHARERFHPFNTARIVQMALQNSRLLVDSNSRLADAELPLKRGAGLLYPGPGAQLISELTPQQQPSQLVVLDGTWHQAKTLYRDIGALAELPCYCLAPSSPGRYRIRREPNDMSLSTLEATVEALRFLEPEIDGLDRLVDAFDVMVEGQIACPKSECGRRRNRKRDGTLGNIPRALLDGMDNVVVAYGESVGGRGGRTPAARMPVYWVAQHMGTGRRFAHAIEPAIEAASPRLDTLMGHWELAAEDFAQALCHEEFRNRWADFCGKGDTLVAYHQSTVRLLENIGVKPGRSLVLKSINLDPQRHIGTLEELLAAEGLVSEPAELPSRAGKRLAMAVTLVRHLGGRRNDQGSIINDQ